MSWQAYVDGQLIATGNVTKAAIFGIQGGQWATSAGFATNDAEVKALVAGFSNPDSLYGGIHIGGTKYMYLQSTDSVIVGRKGGDAGCVVAKSTQAVIVAVFEGGIQPGAARATVEKLADYLKSVGY